MKASTLEFIGFEMYVKGKTKEELDALSGFQVIMEKDDFDRWKKHEYNYQNDKK